MVVEHFAVPFLRLPANSTVNKHPKYLDSSVSHFIIYILCSFRVNTQKPSSQRDKENISSFHYRSYARWDKDSKASFCENRSPILTSYASSQAVTLVLVFRWLSRTFHVIPQPTDRQPEEKEILKSWPETVSYAILYFFQDTEKEKEGKIFLHEFQAFFFF